MDQTLSPRIMRRARIDFQAYNILNSFGFLFLNGSILTLFAMKLGATGSYLGLLNSLSFMTFFFMPIGKIAVRHFPIVKVFATAWVLRFLSMAPILAAPALYAAGMGETALGVILFSSAAFSFFRGVGLIGNNPVIGSLVKESGRGKLLVSLQMAGSAVNIAAALMIAFVLGRDASSERYLAFMAIGIAAGVAGSLLLFRIPEPSGFGTAARESTLVKSTLDALGKPSFRRFMVVFFVVSFVAGTVRTFLPVYSKSVYGQSDALVILYTVAGSIGSLGMGLLAKLLLDRYGAKPLIVIFTVATAISLLPAVISPELGMPFVLIGLLAGVNLFSNFGMAGQEAVAQAYYFSLIPKECVLDLSVIYYFVFGLAGAAGSLLSGFFIDVFGASGLSPASSYRILFAGCVVLLAVVTALERGLARLGSSGIAETLGVVFSIRDLREIALLDRLDVARTGDEEAVIIQGMGSSDATTVRKGLLSKLRSPRFKVRVEALLALERSGDGTPETVSVLIDEVGRNEYTTAYLAARILGKSGDPRAIPALKASMRSGDYMLAGESMLALARLRAVEAIPDIEDAIARSENPRVLVFAAVALEEFGSRSSIPVILDFMRRETPPEHARDELTLAMAYLFGMESTFHKAYAAFLSDPREGWEFLRDRAEALSERDPAASGAAVNAVLSMSASDYDGAACAKILLRLPERLQTAEDVIVAEAALDPALERFPRLKFLFAAYAVERAASLGGEP